MERIDEQPTAESSTDAPRRDVRRGGLARTLLLVFLPMVIGLLILAGVAGIIASQQISQTQAFQQLNLVATLKEDGIGSWLRERDRDMAVLADDHDVREDAGTFLNPETPEAESLEAYTSLKLQFDDFWGIKISFAEFFILDPQDGQAVVSTDDLQEGTIHVSEDYFQEGLLGPYFRPPEYDRRAGVPTIMLSRPVLALDGSTVGVLVGRAYVGDLIVLMQERTGMGETGETYLVDQDYQPITHLRSGVAGQQVSTEGAKRAIEDKRSGSSRYANYRNVPVFGDYRWIPGLQAALLAEMSETEALSSRNVVSLAVVGIVLLGAGIAAAVIVFVSRRITQPITQLTEVASEMAAGDLSQRVTVDRTDEIGTLSQAFDDMADQVEDLIGELEQRVAERTADLERRAVQLETASEVGRAAASILDLDILTRRVAALIQERFEFYYVGLFLVDDAAEFAVLEAGTGEPGRIMKEAEHKLRIGGRSMVGAACDQRRARIALDVGEESVRFDNPLLPATRSEMALPLMVGDRVLGAMDVQSEKSAAFSEEDIEVLQLVANQVAVSIDNAHKFSEEAGLLEATSPLYRVSRRLATAITTEEIVETVISSISETEADGCAVGRLDFSSTGRIESATFLGSWDRDQEAGFPIGIPFVSGASPFPLEMVTSYWTVEDIEQDASMRQSAREFLSRFQGRAFVNVPLRVGQQVIGFVSIYRRSAGSFSPVSTRLYETLVDQAAVALERARLLDTTHQRAEHEASLRSMGDRIARATGVEPVLQAAAESLNRALQGSGVYVELGGLTAEELEARQAERKPSPLL